MNTIKIYLSSSGSLAELKKDFPLYQGSFNDKLLNVYVPTSLLPGTVDTQYVDETGFVHTEPGVFTALKIGMVSIGRDGRVNKTNAYYMRYLKKLVYQGIEYALYERALPQAFTLFEGQGSQAPKLIINVVNMENNNEYNGEEVILGEPKILQVITSQQCSLDVLPSASFDRDALIEPSEWEILNGKIDDLYEKYDYIVNNIDETIANYTYSKDVIDQKDADTLQLAKDYADENFYNETESDARFVHLTGNETIGGTKTFENSPIVPNPTANTHTVNRQSMYNYAYSKSEVNRITQGISFDTKAQFELWLAGSYTRPDGLLPSDMIIGKKVFIIEANQPNYRCISLPATSLSNFEVLAEDIKDLQEITATPYKTITAENGQAFVNELKDQVDLKAQIIELEDLTIETTDWIEDSGNIYFDYENENFTDPTKQFFEFVSNDKDQNESIASEGFSVLAVGTVVVGGVYKVRLSANKVPSIDIVLKVNLINYTNEVFEAGEITANKIIYSNTISGLIATEVQGAIDELKGITDDLESDKVDKSAIKQTTGSSTTDIMSQKAISDELALKATIVDVNLKVDKSSIKQVIGSSTTDLMSQKAISDELDLKADKTYVDDELASKVDKTEVVQTTGSSTTNIMSQKAVTDLYNGEVLFDNPSGATSIDFSTWGLADGDVLEIEYSSYGIGTNLVAKIKLTELSSDTDVFLPTYVGSLLSLYMHLLINNTTKIITVYAGSYSFPDRTQATRNEKVYKITRVEKGA